MFKTVPTWVFLLFLLFGIIFTMLFGWKVKSTVENPTKGGISGEIALALAQFPSTTYSVYQNIFEEKDEWVRVPAMNADLTEFTEIEQMPGLNISGLVIRASKTGLKRAPGWRILVGSFVIDGKFENAALALSPELKVVKIWHLTENQVPGITLRPPHRKFIHGFDVMSDGSAIFSFDGGGSLQRIDNCGSSVWGIAGYFHHSVTLDDQEQSVFALFNDGVAQVSTATGEIMRHFTMEDIVAANPDIDILEIHQIVENDLGGNGKNTSEVWLEDPFHLNDVDPLPAKLADRFDGFDAGDLLISARALNLIFVLAPDTLKIKWWRFGATRRQHDPDWSASGGITVFDNRMSRDYSRIVRIDPKSYQTSILYDGRENDFYSRIRGKHQFTETGNLLVTSSQQGRVFELAPDGTMVLEIINNKPGDDEVNYTISQALWLNADAFKFAENTSCQD